MKYLKHGLFSAILLLSSAVLLAPLAQAQYYYGRTPSLSVSQVGSSGTVSVSISNADANSRAVLYARPSGGSTWSTTVDPIGQTDGSGYLNVTTYLGTGLNEFYVTVNGASSNTAYLNGYNGGCTYNCGSPYGLSLSQSNLNLNSGQSATVTVYTPYSSNFYISSNSNSAVASASISGATVTVYGNTTGSTTITICQNNYGSNCASVYVTVSGGSSSSGNVWFSPSSPSLYTGQSLAVSISSSAYATGLGYYNPYYISSNSNPSAVTASVSGTVLNLYANQTGNSSITVCHNSLGYCGTLYVTVNGSSTGNLTFSQTSVYLTAGQSQYVAAYNSYTGSLYVSSNSNSSVASVSISGNQINITGITSGSTNIGVCAQNGGCGNIYVSVSGSTTGSISASQTNVNLTGNQTSTVNIYSTYGSNGFYISSNSNSSVVSASLAGNVLYLTSPSYAQNGNSTVTVCQSGISACVSVYVTVNGSNYSGNLYFTPSSISINSGQSQTVNIYNNGTYYSGSYYVSSNSNSGVASASISGNILTVYGNSTGSTTITVCQNTYSNCGSLYVTVSGGYYGGNLTFSTLTLPAITLNQYYSYQLQVWGGNSPYTFTLQSGQLPAGLTLSPSGMISGTAYSASYSNFTIRVNDVYGRTATANFVINGGGVLGSSTYPSGQLINENGTIYIVYRGQKSAFSSMTVFRGFGFKLGNVLNTGFTNLSDTGYVISRSNTSHPWGSWIQSGNTIYFVHQDGLIPVPSWDVFINNRGASGLIVPANGYDFNLPQLAPMVSGDGRLN